MDNLSAIIAEGVKPSLGELEKFEDQPEGLDMEGKSFRPYAAGG